MGFSKKFNIDASLGKEISIKFSKSLDSGSKPGGGYFRNNSTASAQTSTTHMAQLKLTTNMQTCRIQAQTDNNNSNVQHSTFVLQW